MRSINFLLTIQKYIEFHKWQSKVNDVLKISDKEYQTLYVIYHSVCRLYYYYVYVTVLTKQKV